MDSWEYSALVILMQRGHITSDQLLILATASIEEVLFDLLQINRFPPAELTPLATSGETQQAVDPSGAFRIEKYSGIRPAGNYIMPRTLTLMMAPTIAAITQDLEQWIRVSSRDIHPNQVPVMKKPEVLERKIVAKAYKNLLILTNGNYTIRDIAEILQKKPWEVINLFMLHIRNEDLGLIEVADTPSLEEAKIISSHPSPTQEHIPGAATSPEELLSGEITLSPVVVCIDHSVEDCETMGITLQGLGYEFLPITNEVEALPQLIKKVPDIIFIDLLMPIINGYELCRHIRRIAVLEKIPVIILAEKASIADRVRAKIAGVTDFLPKPVTPERLLETLQKYIDLEDISPSQSVG
jgi:chemotaxis family two-component system response regulator PixG